MNKLRVSIGRVKVVREDLNCLRVYELSISQRCGVGRGVSFLIRHLI